MDLEKLSEDQLSILDVGSRDGISEEWKDFESYVNFIPIEAAKDAVGENFLIAGENSNSAIFYNTRFPHSSGMLKADEKFQSRFAELHNKNLEVISIEHNHSLTIDSYLEKKNFTDINFLKLDTEGNEHHILGGATDLLLSKSLFAVKSEIWLGPIKDENEFSLIDALLRRFNFQLFDMQFSRYPRNSLPNGVISGQKKMKSDGNTLGQFLTGDVIYIKDPIYLLNKNLDLFDWTDPNVLKLALIYKVYNCPDASLELLIFYENNYASSLDFHELKNFFTPKLPNGSKVKYDEYLALSKKLSIGFGGYERHWRTKTQ